MNITGKTRLFLQKRQGSKGEFIKFTTNISTKQKDGSYVNMSCDVIFDKEKYPEATLNKLKTDCNYNLEIASGTLMVREFEGKNGTQQVLVIYVTDCTINDEKKTNHKKSKDSLI
ncbi:MAG: hypothetical protein IKE95_03760 [Methanobrevibacter sp.]|nr:hypothetical protein [Methanobrevibacter sp.]